MNRDKFLYPNLLKTHTHCLLCGAQNPLGLRLNFSPDVDGCVSASFKGQWLLQGYNGVLHGGVISSLLDAAMTHCLFYRGIEAVTAELVVRFLRPVPLDAQVEICARLLSERPPLFRLRAELQQGGQTMAYARAKFMRRNQDQSRLATTG